MKIHLKISSVKWRPFCPGGDELKYSVCEMISALEKILIFVPFIQKFLVILMTLMRDFTPPSKLGCRQEVFGNPYLSQELMETITNGV